MAYLKPHIYVIGGSNEKGLIDNVERFVIANYEWEVMPPLLRKCHHLSAVVMGDKLLVYGCYQKPKPWERKPEKYMYQGFDAKTKTWYMAGVSEEYNPDVLMKPTLMEHQGRYYRVAYQVASTTAGNSGNFKEPGDATVVQEVTVSIQDGSPNVSLGSSLDQSGIPKNEAGAFRIGDDVFVNASGYIHNTGIKVSSFAGGEVDLGPWKLVNIDASGKNKYEVNLRDSVVCFTFDPKKAKPWKL